MKYPANVSGNNCNIKAGWPFRACRLQLNPMRGSGKKWCVKSLKPSKPNAGLGMKCNTVEGQPRYSNVAGK